MKNRIIITACFFFLMGATGIFGQGQFKAFLFTKTAGFHHESIHDGVTAMRKLAKKHHFSMDWHEDAKKFTDEGLKNYDVIIFLSTTEEILNDEQQEVFKRFIQSGKGFVGIHAASDTEYDWLWYNRLVGRMFHIHPQNQTAMIDVQDRNFPGMEVFPDRFMWTDEWYQFKEEKYSENIKVLLTVDESTYNTYAKWGDKVGGDMGVHPISWYQDYDGGRSFYTALGHISEVYSDPWFLSHVYGGIYWAATGKGIKE